MYEKRGYCVLELPIPEVNLHYAASKCIRQFTFKKKLRIPDSRNISLQINLLSAACKVFEASESLIE